MNQDSMRASVTQRSFIASSLPIAFRIAAVPLAEVASTPEDVEDEAFLRRLASEITGSPEELILDDEGYSEIGRALTVGESARAWLAGSHRRWTDRAVAGGLIDLHDRSIRSPLLGSPRSVFAHDMMAFLARPTSPRHALIVSVLVDHSRNRAPVLDAIAPTLTRNSWPPAALSTVTCPP